MKIKHVLASLALASVTAFGLVAGLSAKKEAKFAKATSFAFEGSFAMELQNLGGDQYWDDAEAKFIAKIYNSSDVGLMCSFWSDLVAGDGSHKVVMTYASNEDPSGPNTKLELYRLPKTVDTKQDAIDAVSAGEVWNKALSVTYGQMVYVYGWDNAANGVKYYIGADSNTWSYDWDSSLHHAKVTASGFELYSDVILDDDDNFKLVTDDNGTKGYFNGYDEDPSVSGNFTCPSSDNILADKGGRYSFYSKIYNSNRLYITDPVVAEAEEYAQSFNSSVGAVCNTDHDAEDYLSNLQAAWNTQKTAYLNLEGDVQAKLTNAKADEKGTYLEQFAAKYDGIVTKYGESKFPEFANRFEETVVGTYSSIGFMDNTFASSDGLVMFVIIASSLVAITSLTVLLILKKKRK